MKNKLITSILFLLGFVVAYSQAPLNFSARLNVTNVTGSDPYTVTGVVQSDLGIWNASNINVIQDSVYHLEGGDLLIYRIVSITSASGNNFVMVLDDIDDSGNLPSTGTEWCALQFTTNFQFSLEVGNLPTNLKAAIDNRFKQRLDAAMAVSGIVGTSGSYTPTIVASDTLLTNYPATYTIVDSVVTVIGLVRIGNQAGSLVSSITISLPPGGAKNFTAQYGELRGKAEVNQSDALTTGLPRLSCLLSCDFTNDLAFVSYEPIGSGGVNRRNFINYSFSYKL